MRYISFISLFLIAALAIRAQDGQNNETPDDIDSDAIILSDEPERCIHPYRLRQTKVISDETIVFYQRGGDIYVNNLRQKCPGLSRSDRFSYEVRFNQLCRSDYITVLEQFAGGISPGFRCQLGYFQPITEDALAVMVETSESGGSRRSATATPVELPLPEEESDDSSVAEPSVQ